MIKDFIVFIINEMNPYTVEYSEQELLFLLNNKNYTKLFYNIDRMIRLIHKNRINKITSSNIDIKINEDSLEIKTKHIDFKFFNDYFYNLFLKDSSQKWLFDIKFQKRFNVTLKKSFDIINSEMKLENLIKILCKEIK